MNKIKSLLNLIHKCRTNLKCFKQIHAQLITTNLVNDSLVMCNAIEFFKNSSDFEYACQFLNQLPHPYTTSFPFNTLITCYADSKTPRVAILVYKLLLRNGFCPDMYTFPVVLKACSKVLKIGEGRQFHGVVVKVGLVFDLYVSNALVHFYSCCGDCDYSRNLFDEMPVRDVVSWTSLISGFVRAGLFREAVMVFSKMEVEPNVGTLVSVLVGCGRIGDYGLGRAVHGLIFKREFEVRLMLGNALMDMYVKCTRLDEAKQVFCELQERDIISWTCIISGLVQCKHPKEALEFFHDMQVSGVEPDKVTLSSVFSACASLGAIDYGRWVHEYVDRHGIEWDAHIGTSMVDMYAKCGSVEMALCTFHRMHHRNVFTWNALLGGLAMHGHGKEALGHFKQMLNGGVRPNEVTFLAILTACCHNGLVDEGSQQFNQMIQVYNLIPGIEHYGCMIDLLCRAGFLDEAQKLVKFMPMQPDVFILGALLSACKACGDVETSRNILSHLLQLDSDDSGVYVLLSNIFVSNNRWEDAAMVRRVMKAKGIKKFPGSSVIEIDGKTHEFMVGNSNNPQQEDVHLLLNSLAKQVYLDGRIWNPVTAEKYNS